MTEEKVSPSEIAPETSTETSQEKAFNFGEYFPEDVKNDPDFERISKNLPLDKPELLAKELYHKTKHFGKVKEEMRKELEGEFNKKYTPEEYSYDLPENYQANEEILGTIKEKALELGVKPEAFKTLVETFAGKEQEFISKMQEEAEAEFNAKLKEEAEFLKGKHGADSDALIEQAKKNWGSFTDPRYKDLFDNFDKGTQLVLADMLSNISQKVSEPTTGKPQGGFSMSKETALSKIEEIRADKSLNDIERQNKLSVLYPIAYQGETAKSLGVISDFSKFSS